MKKLAAAITALFLLALFPAIGRAASLSPQIVLSALWDEIPEDAAFLELLVSGEDLERQPDVREYFGIKADSEIARYDENGFCSLSFQTDTPDCSPWLTYYANFYASEEEYRQYQAQFERLGSFIEYDPSQAYPYSCEWPFGFDTGAAEDARALSEALGFERPGKAICSSVFGTEEAANGKIFKPAAVKAAFVDRSGAILKLSKVFSLDGYSEDEIVLMFSGDALVPFNAYGKQYAFSVPWSTFFAFFAAMLGLAFFAALLFIRIVSSNRMARARAAWLPDFISSADRRLARAEMKARQKNGGSRKGVLLRILLLAVAFASMYAIGIRTGQVAAREDGSVWVVLMCVSWVFMLWINVILHELGHVLFGKCTGYRLLWVMIGSVGLRRENGRLRFFRRPLYGAGGATSMAPPDCPDPEIRLAPFYLGGVIVNAATALACLIPALLLKNEIARLEFGAGALLALIMAISNAIPGLSLGRRSDGEQIRDFRRGGEARNSQLRMLRTSALTHTGKRLSQLDPALFTDPFAADLTNGSVAQSALLTWERAMDGLDFGAARRIGARLMAEDAALPDVWKAKLALGNLYCDLIDGVYTQEPSDYLTETQKLILKKLPYQPFFAAVRHGYELLYRRDLNAAFTAKRLLDRMPEDPLDPCGKETARAMIAAAEARARAWGLIQ